MMKLSEKVWQKNALVYQSILTHPFNVELAKGILSKERFCFYMAQDAYYLKHFSKALALMAGRSTESKLIDQFLKFAGDALIAERQLHAHYIENMDHTEPTLACLSYTNYLISMASTASFEEAAAAILPCFWVYRDVGRYIAFHSDEFNPYADWISTYSCQEFSDATERAIAIFDELAEESSSKQIYLMEAAFDCSILLEWHFWNDAYKMVLFQSRDGLINQNQIDLRNFDFLDKDVNGCHPKYFA